MFICFAVFILACGTTHLMEIWNIWHPTYWLTGGVKALTAAASVPTSILLMRLVPFALKLPSPAVLETANDQLRREISERKVIEQRLLAAEEKLAGILDSIDNVVWSVSETELLYINSVAEEIYGRSPDQFFQNKNLLYEVVHPEDQARVRSQNEKLGKQNALIQEYRIVRPDGSIRWLEERAKVVRNAAGEMLRIDSVGMDITERKEHQARIEHLADHDALTDLANRNLLGDRVSQALHRTHRTGRLLVLLFLDLDRFKDINCQDPLGYKRA